jgi:hypothetical protein
MLQNNTMFFLLIAIIIISWSICMTDIFKTSYAAIDEKMQAIEIARKFVISGPTYSFDGINGTLVVKSNETIKSNPPQYITEISFDSEHDGYGDRHTTVLPQMITSHTVSINIVSSQIMSATIDGIWDELNNNFIHTNDINHRNSTSEYQNQLKVYPLTLQLNQTAKFADGKYAIVFFKVIQDSRCPSDVTCVRAGDASIQVNVVTAKNETKNINLILDDNNKDSIVSIFGYSIKLFKLSPYPSSNTKPLISEYVASIAVSEQHMSPKQQIKNGILPKDIICSKGLVLVQKSSNSTVACVKSESIQKLIEREWTNSINHFNR